jgi:teichuronic acid biosynthesis glycosyltransferase TuaG
VSIKVSVVIPTYNRFDYLLNAVNSIKDQNFSDFEILIINDGSTDENYYENKLSGTNIKQIDLEENQKIKNGFASDAIRNIGIEHARGKYIAFLDDDDYWMPNKLELQIGKLETGEFNLTCSDAFANNGMYDVGLTNKRFNQEIVFK